MTDNTQAHRFKPNGFGSDHCLECGGKTKDHRRDKQQPDNTQELDYTHPDERPTVEHRPSPNSDLRGMIVHFTSEMLDNPDNYGIYPTTNFYNDLEEAILDWHKKQVVQSELDILNHLLRPDKHGAEPTAHLIRLRAIQMQGSAESRLDTGRPRRTTDEQHTT